VSILFIHKNSNRLKKKQKEVLCPSHQSLNITS